MFHLVEAEEFQDGGGRVEDVAFGGHHQHEAVQRLRTKQKTFFRARWPFFMPAGGSTLTQDVQQHVYRCT